MPAFSLNQFCIQLQQWRVSPQMIQMQIKSCLHWAESTKRSNDAGHHFFLGSFQCQWRRCFLISPCSSVEEDVLQEECLITTFEYIVRVLAGSNFLPRSVLNLTISTWLSDLLGTSLFLCYWLEERCGVRMMVTGDSTVKELQTHCFHLVSVWLLCVLFVWKSGSCPCSQLPAGLVGAAQQWQQQRLTSLSYTDALHPQGNISSGVYPTCFVNTGHDVVTVCLSFQTSVKALFIAPRQSLWNCNTYKVVHSIIYIKEISIVIADAITFGMMWWSSWI